MFDFIICGFLFAILGAGTIFGLYCAFRIVFDSHMPMRQMVHISKREAEILADHHSAQETMADGIGDYARQVKYHSERRKLFRMLSQIEVGKPENIASSS